MTRRIDTCISPALIPYYDVTNRIVVVIDIFRATSAICYAIENEAKGIIPVKDVEECISYRDTDYLLAAERNGKTIEGFSLGNSPRSYTPQLVKDKTIVLTTTNGTQAIHAAKDAHKIVIGSFLNLSALAEWLAQQEENILLLCSGWKNQYCLEDTIFAGALVSLLKNSFSNNICDGSISAEILYKIASDNLLAFTQQTSHNARLHELNLEEDIKLCLHIDLCTSIPILNADKTIIKLL